jgi:hypothetical protein
LPLPFPLPFVPRRSLFSISRAVDASWSKSLCGSREGLVNVEPEAEWLVRPYGNAWGPNAGDVPAEAL